MFIVDGTNITLTRGDTGTLTLTATGYTFDSSDRAVFTIKDANGTEIKRQQAEMTNGSFDVDFLNADTEGLAPGMYNWDVRYVIGPYYDADGRIINGDQVVTPNQPMNLHLINAVGEV